MSIVDVAERAAVIDPLRSFCVTAPAGSGKTELLIQRYLALLARVQQPEQVLAITFTRKAAAEMIARVLQALRAASMADPVTSGHEQVTRDLAEQVLRADIKSGWRLLQDASRLNIRTIDSFCGTLTRQMPVLSEIGGQALVADDAGDYYAEAVGALFATLEDSQNGAASDLAAVMLHFDNNWERLQELLVAMLARRDQWREYVGVHHDPERAEAYLLSTVERLLRSELAPLTAHLAPYAAQLLDLQAYAARNLGVPAPSRFPGSDPADLAAWRSVQALLQTKQRTWRRQLNRTMGFPAGKGEAQKRKDELAAILAELAEIDGLEARLSALTYLPQVEAGGDAWHLLVHLSRLLPRLAAELLLVFQRHGVVDYSQVALSALQALGDDDAPTELALRLDYQIEHVLVDEFQDTSISQYELLRCLTRGWGAHNALQPQAPRTVLVVGDGMQSIYGFRGANVGLFLKARDEGFNGVQLEHLALRSNFRSQQGLVDWVNEAFTSAFPPTDDVGRGQVAYQPARAVRPAMSQPAVGMHAFQGESARAQEVDFICSQIAGFCRQGDGRTLAVLGRTRGHLQDIIARLKVKSIDYCAPDLDSLASSTLVFDLMTLCRALANNADRVAWMALLRAPWCGLTLADLLLLGRWGESPRYQPLAAALTQPKLLAQLSADGRARLSNVADVMQRAHETRDRRGLRAWVEQAWLGLGGPAAADEYNQLADAEHFFQLLEQAEQEGRGLDIAWLTGRVENDYRSAGESDAPVQLMTLHKAKGLEFDRVIIPRLDAAPRHDDRELMLWDEYCGPDGVRGFLLAANDNSRDDEHTLYNYLRHRRREKALLEGTRLLYVGATRAIDELTLTAAITWDDKKEEYRAPAARTLLSRIWPGFTSHMRLHEKADRGAVVDALPAAPALRRFTAPMSSPLGLSRRDDGPGAAAATGEVGNIPQRPVNHRERSVGTVVHLALEMLATQAQLPNSEACIALQRDGWRVALQSRGVSGAALDASLSTVERAIALALAPESVGRWLLSSTHEDAHSEWALATADPYQGLREIIIDRTFIDGETGLRWLIDYKTSAPGSGQTLADFLAGESDLYRSQLLRYRDALRALDQRPMRCALYFTELGQLHIIDDLSC